jgi:GLPGLI family protein
MNKFIFTFAFFLFGILSVSAQKDFQGLAVYESKTSTSDVSKRMDNNKEMSPELKKMIEQRMKGMSEKTFVLNFDRSSSIYKEEEKLDAPGTSGGMRMWSSMMGGGGTYYKNVKDKTYSVDKEFMGKEFLIIDALLQLEWKMDSETKQVGGYTCYKATAMKPIDGSDFRSMRAQNKDKKDEDKKDGKKEENKEQSTNFMDGFEIPKEVLITAWYTPEIPVNQGPEGYWGLPGLILEVNDGKTIILCSKVVINAKEKAEIKAPNVGKEVTQKEYDEIVAAKMKEMQEMGGRPGGGGRFGR